MDLQLLDFIGQIVNRMKSNEGGYSCSTKWLALNEDLQAEYRLEGMKMFEDWKRGELEAQERRNSIMAGVKIIKWGEFRTGLQDGIN